MSRRKVPLLIAALGLLGLGIAYAVEIQRGVSGLVIVSQVETAEEKLIARTASGDVASANLQCNSPAVHDRGEKCVGS